MVELGSLKLTSRHLAVAVIALKLITDLLAFADRTKVRALYSRDVHEHVRAAVVRLNEAEALLVVEPLNCSDSHFSPLCGYSRISVRTSWRKDQNFGEGRGQVRGSIRNRAGEQPNQSDIR